MIPKLLADLAFKMVSLFTALINIPPLPDQVENVMNQALDYIKPGVSILSCYFDVEYLFALFGIVVAFDAGVLIYKFVLWVLNKIPCLDID